MLLRALLFRLAVAQGILLRGKRSAEKGILKIKCLYKKRKRQISQDNVLHVVLLMLGGFAIVRVLGTSVNQIIPVCCLDRGESCPCPRNTKWDILNPVIHTFQHVNEEKIRPSVLYHVHVSGYRHETKGRCLHL